MDSGRLISPSFLFIEILLHADGRLGILCWGRNSVGFTATQGPTKIEHCLFRLSAMPLEIKALSCQKIQIQYCNPCLEIKVMLLQVSSLQGCYSLALEIPFDIEGPPLLTRQTRREHHKPCERDSSHPRRAKSLERGAVDGAQGHGLFSMHQALSLTSLVWDCMRLAPFGLFEARSAFEIIGGPPIFGRPMGPGVLAVSFWGSDLGRNAIMEVFHMAMHWKVKNAARMIRCFLV